MDQMSYRRHSISNRQKKNSTKNHHTIGQYADIDVEIKGAFAKKHASMMKTDVQCGTNSLESAKPRNGSQTFWATSKESVFVCSFSANVEKREQGVILCQFMSTKTANLNCLNPDKGLNNNFGSWLSSVPSFDYHLNSWTNLPSSECCWSAECTSNRLSLKNGQRAQTYRADVTQR